MHAKYIPKHNNPNKRQSCFFQLNPIPGVNSRSISGKSLAISRNCTDTHASHPPPKTFFSSCRRESYGKSGACSARETKNKACEGRNPRIILISGDAYICIRPKRLLLSGPTIPSLFFRIWISPWCIVETRCFSCSRVGKFFEKSTGNSCAYTSEKRCKYFDFALFFLAFTLQFLN